MGKWKYLNFLVIIVILVFMFGTLASRYHVGTFTYLLVISGIVFLTIAGTYIFMVRINMQKPPSKGISENAKNQINNIKTRPKVVLKPRNKNNE